MSQGNAGAFSGQGGGQGHAHAPASGEGEVRMELPSKTAYLCAVREFTREVCKRRAFDEDQVAQIVLALDEALANVMKHGYQGRTDGRIWIGFSPFESGPRGPGIRIVVEDEARQVDPSTIKSRDLADVRPGGLGVHIIREVMDEATYEKRAGAGMRLTLVKHVSSPAVCTSPRVRDCSGGTHG
jgi:anti-sigma regulatory factor (Ser/Thr protein kinase)